MLNWDDIELPDAAIQAAIGYLKDEPCRNNPDLYAEYVKKLAYAIDRTVQEWFNEP